MWKIPFLLLVGLQRHVIYMVNYLLRFVVCGLVGFQDKGTTIVLGGKLPMPHQMCGRLHMIVLQVDTLLPNCELVANHRQSVGYTHTTDRLQAKLENYLNLWTCANIGGIVKCIR